MFGRPTAQWVSCSGGRANTAPTCEGWHARAATALPALQLTGRRATVGDKAAALHRAMVALRLVQSLHRLHVLPRSRATFAKVRFHSLQASMYGDTLPPHRWKRVQGTHTMATPITTVTTDAMTAREKVLPSQKCSTRHTNGMMSSLAICAGTHDTLVALRGSRDQTVPQQASNQ